MANRNKVYCPHCGLPMYQFENPPRFKCTAHGDIDPRDAVVRPDPSQPLLGPDEAIVKRKGRRYLHRPGEDEK